MSHLSSDKEDTATNLPLHNSRSSMPFTEENEVHLKTEIKTEAQGGSSSPLFEPQTSIKRDVDGEISASDVKRSKPSAESGPPSYGGGPVRTYAPGTPYKYSRHEVMPVLEINSQHHQKATQDFLFNIREVVLPALCPFENEDKSLGDSVKWFRENARIPSIAPTQFALSGNSGSGKTSTLNNLLGVIGLANADASMESVTQNPQIFNHGTQNQVYQVEVLFLNRRSIMNLILRCVKDLTSYSKLLSSGEMEDEIDLAREAAESSRQVLDDLFSHQNGFKSLDDLEDFMETKSLLAEDGECVSDAAVDALYKEILQRATAEGIDLDRRSLHLTAGNVGELRGKTAKFSERGAFAPLVSSMRTKFYSPLLAMGIEIADLPGYTDTNFHLRKTSLAYSDACPKAIFVADLSRCLTTPELDKSLRQTIKLKGAENVCLVLRGKEVVDKAKSRWTKDETAKLETLEKSLKSAKSLQNNEDEQIQTRAKVDMARLECEILEHRISVRDRVVTDYFSQKKFQNRTDSKTIRVITVANKCHEQYMLGTRKATLSHDKTGIKELRAYMCETPSRDQVRAFARHSAKCITKMRRIRFWAEGPKMPPRDAAMALFEQHARWGFEGDLSKLSKAVKEYRKLLNKQYLTSWEDASVKVMENWANTYAARTQGVFLRQGGRHSPKLKNSTEKKPKLVSWNEDLLMVAEEDVLSLLKPICEAVNEVEGYLCERIEDGVEKIRHGLEMMETIAGTNLESVWGIFEDEMKSCIRDIKESIAKLEANLRTEVLKSVADEACDVGSPVFITETVAIFGRSIERFPKGSKNLTKERMKFIKEQIANAKGPYSRMSDEIVTRITPVIKIWAQEANARIKQMQGELRDVLFKSFEGKKMSDARREQIAPAIKAAMDKAGAVLQANLDNYPVNII